MKKEGSITGSHTTVKDEPTPWWIYYKSEIDVFAPYEILITNLRKND